MSKLASCREDQVEYLDYYTAKVDATFYPLTEKNHLKTCTLWTSCWKACIKAKFCRIGLETVADSFETAYEAWFGTEQG